MPIKSVQEITNIIFDAVSSALKMTLATLISGEDQANNCIRTAARGYSYLAISGDAVPADTAVKASAGVIARISVTVVGGGGSTVSVYDGTVAAGTLIATIGGDALGVTTLEAYCATSIHIAAHDDAATLRLVALYI